MSELSNDVRAKVLIAEDDAIVALDLQGMVMRLGYDVVAIVDSGAAAIASAQRFMPDIILLDMVLKGSLDGIEVAKEIHKSFDVPVVFCVSSPDLSILVRAKEIAYAGYLLKPINPDSLSTTLDTALYKYKLEKRVESAEEKFRHLTEACDVLNYFLDQKAAFHWNWAADQGVLLTGYSGFDDIPAALLEERINELVSAPETLTDNRISGLIELTSADKSRHVFCVIGIRLADSTSCSGMILPLAGGTR